MRAGCKMTAGTRGLGEGQDPHLLDVNDLVFDAWISISVQTIARCLMEADILPRPMHACPIAIHVQLQLELIFQHRKPLSSRKRECYSQEVEEISRSPSEIRIERRPEQRECQELSFDTGEITE